jgi:hypothetical protein
MLQSSAFGLLIEPALAALLRRIVVFGAAIGAKHSGISSRLMHRRGQITHRLSCETSAKGMESGHFLLICDGRSIFTRGRLSGWIVNSGNLNGNWMSRFDLRKQLNP